MRIILNRPNEIPTVQDENLERLLRGIAQTDESLERRLLAMSQLRAAQMRAYSDAIHGFSDNPVRDRLLAEWMQRREYKCGSYSTETILNSRP